MSTTVLTREVATVVLARHPTWAHCPSCGEMFTSDSAFDRHLGPIPKVGPPSCKAPADVKRGQQGLVFDQAKGAWRWEDSGDQNRPRRLSPNAQEPRARSRASAEIPDGSEAA